MSRPAGMIRKGWRRVVICSSGNSFTPAQAEAIADAQRDGLCRVIVVNDNWRRVPSADLLWAGDAPWWKENLERVRAAKFAGELWTADEYLVGNFAREVPFRWVREVHEYGLTRTPYLLHGAGNGTIMATNLAYLFGVEEIAQVGLDMKPAPAKADGTPGQQHWFGEHPFRDPKSRIPFAAFIERFGLLAPDLRAAGVRCVQCSPYTDLHCFDERPLGEVLEGWRAAA